MMVQWNKNIDSYVYLVSQLLTTCNSKKIIIYRILSINCKFHYHIFHWAYCQRCYRCVEWTFRAFFSLCLNFKLFTWMEFSFCSDARDIIRLLGNSVRFVGVYIKGFTVMTTKKKWMICICLLSKKWKKDMFKSYYITSIRYC